MKIKMLKEEIYDPELNVIVSKRCELGGFWKAQAEWSQQTFGTDKERGCIGPLKHLAKEAVEAQEHPTDLMEFVDCLFLTFDATRRAGFTFEQLCEAAWEKLEINKKRKWSKPTDDNPVEHIRDINEKLKMPQEVIDALNNRPDTTMEDSARIMKAFDIP